MASAELTDREMAELIRKSETQTKKVMPKTRNEKKKARIEFKAMRMKLRRDEKKALGLTRSDIDRKRNLQSV